MKFQRNVLLKNYTTFQIGGRARYFFTARTKNDLTKTILKARKYDLPFFILGGGSNLLISDKEYKGLVIQIKNQRLKIKDNNIYAEAGTNLSQLVNFALKNSLAGLEWAGGIPGQVGGAVRGNAGAFGGSMEDIVKDVEVLDVVKNKIKTFKKKDCQFRYRSSVFKKNPNLIVLSCWLQLKSGDKGKIKEKVQEYLDYRRKRHPKEPSAGCVFKNPKNSSARELIDKCGLKGKRIGGAEISKKHANFIVNLGNAQAKDVLKLIDLMKKEVKNKFNIKLKEEIQILK